MGQPLLGKKILIVTPSFPIPEIGAEQADRAEGIRQFKRLGAEVVVIAKTTMYADHAFIQKTAQDLGVTVVTVPYRYSGQTLSRKEKILKHLGKLRNPLYLDGAAYEYSEPRIQEEFARQLDVFMPDVVWFEYTYLWPLYRLARARKIRIVTRSINYEPIHFLEEDGYTFVNLLKFIPKFFGEWRTVRWSDVMLSITPKEERIYRRLGAKFAATLPLRGLPRFTKLPLPDIRDRKPLHVFFMGSTYAVSHNRKALEDIITYIAPHVEKKAPGSFVFHVLGKKVPEGLEKFFDGNVTIYDGPKYGAELEEFLVRMDVAVVPSLMGAGQQQKVFEPLTRGFPTITSPRAIAGYALEKGVHYASAHTPSEFVQELLALDLVKRRSRASAARTRTCEIFDQQALDMTVVRAVMGQK